MLRRRAAFGAPAVLAILFPALVGVALPGAAPAAEALRHVQLEASDPANGATLELPPDSVRLTFSGPVEAAGASVTLLGSDGQSWEVAASRESANPRVLSGVLPQTGVGGYRVVWRVISQDGHPVEGSFTFVVSGGHPPDAPTIPDPPPHHIEGDEGAAGPVSEGADAMAEGEPHLGPASTMAVRGGVDLALLGLAGLLLFTTWGGGEVTGATRRATTFLAIAAPLLTSAYGFLWSGDVLGGAGVAERLGGLVSLASGRAFAAEILLAWLTLWALLVAHRPALAAALALAAVAAGGFGGHPHSYVPAVAVPASVVHLVAAAAWTGGLLFLVTERGSVAYARSARRVSQLALWSVVAVAVTGLVQTWLFLGSPRVLFASTYGWLVLGKVAGLAALVAFGAYHRFRLVPAAESPSGGAKLSGSVSRELVVAAAVVTLAAVLSHIPPNP
jgi:copper transport protein